MPFDTEHKSYVYYGDRKVECLKQATIFGKTYYDIIVNGIKKTVPASACTAELKQENKKEKRNQ